MTILVVFANKNLMMIVNIRLYLQHFFVNKELNKDFYINFRKIIVLERVGFEIYFCYLKILLLFLFCQPLRSMVLLNCFIELELCLIFRVFILKFSFLFFYHLMKSFAFLRLAIISEQNKFFRVKVIQMILNLFYLLVLNLFRQILLLY